MRFYHFLNEQHTVLTLTKKRNTWILSDENNILLQTTKEEEIIEKLQGNTTLEPKKILNVVKKVGHINFKANDKIYK